MSQQLDIEYISTSRVAMQNFIAPYLGELYSKILKCLEQRPMSAPEINELLHDDLDNVMSRLSELKNDLGKIETVEGEYYYRELINRSGKKKRQPYRIYKLKG